LSEEGRPSSLRQQYAEETTEEDLKEIAEKAPTIKLAYDELDKFRWNENDLVAYEERIMDLRKEEAILVYRLDLATEKSKNLVKRKGKLKSQKQCWLIMLTSTLLLSALVFPLVRLKN
jgi:DNA invertase Pin-like site-specific DNA recombinase